MDTSLPHASNNPAPAVIDIPGGTRHDILRATVRALSLGAQEIEIVMDHAALAQGRVSKAVSQINACRHEICIPNKMTVVVKTNAFGNKADLHAAIKLAADNGADAIRLQGDEGTRTLLMSPFRASSTRKISERPAATPGASGADFVPA